jgi:hypothetical protein
MIIIKRNAANKIQAQYDYQSVTKIQGLVRGWLDRRGMVLKRYLKSLYAHRVTEKQRGIRNRVYRSMRLTNST